MESRESFTRTGSHDEQQTFVASGNSIQCAVDGDALVVTRLVGTFAVVVRDIERFFLLLSHALLQHPLALEHLTIRELIHREIAFHAGNHIVLAERQSVGGIRKRHVQSFSITDSLLQTCGQVFGSSFGFHNGEDIVVVELEDIVGFLLRRTLVLAADGDDTTIGEAVLHAYLILLPSGTLNGGSDKLELDILLGQCV